MKIIYITWLLSTNRILFFFRPIHCYSGEKIICSLKSKSSNRHTISVKILKSICDIISPCTTNIINWSLTTGVFPGNIKKARVTPIPKEGVKWNTSNYRPISVLPVFSKVFEKVAYTQLYDYLENNSVLHEQQYDFRSKKSTTQAILHFLKYLYIYISIYILVMLYFLCSWIFARHLIVLAKRFCYQN